MQNDHSSNCNCLECVKEEHYSQYNDFADDADKITVWKAKSAMNLYAKPDATSHVYRIIKAGGMISDDLHESKNGFIRGAFGWIKDEPEKRYQDSMLVSDNLKYIGLKAAVESNPIAGGKAAGAALDVGKGVKETTEGALDVISFVGRNLKTIIIVLLILVAAYFGFQFLGIAKSVSRG